jgi:hypothetical protein
MLRAGQPDAVLYDLPQSLQGSASGCAGVVAVVATMNFPADAISVMHCTHYHHQPPPLVETHALLLLPLPLLVTMNFPADDMNFTVQLTGSQQFGGHGSSFNSQLGTIQLHPSNDGLFVIGSLNTSMSSSGNALFSGMAMQPVQVSVWRLVLVDCAYFMTRCAGTSMGSKDTAKQCFACMAMQSVQVEWPHQ